MAYPGPDGAQRSRKIGPGSQQSPLHNSYRVYPREVVKAALKHNAAAAILAHNHPSGAAEPSHADEALTASLKQALGLVDVKVLDHFIVAGNAPPLSFAERGLL